MLCKKHYLHLILAVLKSSIPYILHIVEEVVNTVLVCFIFEVIEIKAYVIRIHFFHISFKIYRIIRSSELFGRRIIREKVNKCFSFGVYSVKCRYYLVQNIKLIRVRLIPYIPACDIVKILVLINKRLHNRVHFFLRNVAVVARYEVIYRFAYPNIAFNAVFVHKRQYILDVLLLPASDRHYRKAAVCNSLCNLVIVAVFRIGSEEISYLKSVHSRCLLNLLFLEIIFVLYFDAYSESFLTQRCILSEGDASCGGICRALSIESKIRQKNTAYQKHCNIILLLFTHEHKADSYYNEYAHSYDYVSEVEFVLIISTRHSRI